MQQNEGICWTPSLPYPSLCQHHHWSSDFSPLGTSNQQPFWAQGSPLSFLFDLDLPHQGTWITVLYASDLVRIISVRNTEEQLGPSCKNTGQAVSGFFKTSTGFIPGHHIQVQFGESFCIWATKNCKSPPRMSVCSHVISYFLTAVPYVIDVSPCVWILQGIASVLLFLEFTTLGALWTLQHSCLLYPAMLFPYIFIKLYSHFDREIEKQKIWGTTKSHNYEDSI